MLKLPGGKRGLAKPKSLKLGTYGGTVLPVDARPVQSSRTQLSAEGVGLFNGESTVIDPLSAHQLQTHTVHQYKCLHAVINQPKLLTAVNSLALLAVQLANWLAD